MFRRLPEWLPLSALAILLGIQCIVGARAAISYQSPSSEYLLTARRCVELDDCPSHGGPTDLPFLFHGTSWIRVLSYSLRAGHDQTLAQSIVLGLLILSLLTVFLFVRRYLRLRAATLALGLYLLLVLIGCDFFDLNYPAILPLPLALYYASISLLVEFRRTIFGVVASIALAAAVSAELGCFVLVPFHVLLVALMVRRPVFAVAASCLSFAIPFCWDSMDSARAIVQQLPTVPMAVALAICGGAAALAAWMTRRVHHVSASRSTPQRVRAVMTGALIYVTAAVWLAGLLLQHNLPQPRYLVPAIFPVVYLVAERMGTLGGRATVVVGALESLSLVLLSYTPHGRMFLPIPFVSVLTLFALGTTVHQISWRGPAPFPAQSLWPGVVISLWVIGVAGGDMIVVSARGATQGFTLAEAEHLVRKLYSAGYTYPEILGSIQGPSADDLLPLLAERDPNVFEEPPPYLVNESFSLLTLKVPNAAIPRTRSVIAAVPLDHSRSVIVVRSEQSYLDWIHLRRCRWTGGPGRSAAYVCVEPRTDRPVSHDWPFVEFGESSPLLNASLPNQASDRSVQFEVPVHTPGHAAVHIVRVANEWPSTWRITRVKGVEFEGKLPGVEIRLPDGREAAGIIEFDFMGTISGDLPWVWLPHVMEVTEENEHLLEPFRHGR